LIMTVLSGEVGNTTGKGAEVHMLMVGHSTGHVRAVVENGARDVVFFTTLECLEITSSLSRELRDSGVNVIDTCILYPVLPDSISLMTELVSAKCDEMLSAGNIPVVGLTGGTNLMVAAMSLVATRKKLKCHYICKGSNAMLKIDLPTAFASIGGSV